MQRIEAIFENGILRPLDRVKLRENQHVSLLISTLDRPALPVIEHPPAGDSTALVRRGTREMPPELEEIGLMFELCDRAARQIPGTTAEPGLRCGV